jgi:hypothetical protein
MVMLWLLLPMLPVLPVPPVLRLYYWKPRRCFLLP